MGKWLLPKGAFLWLALVGEEQSREAIRMFIAGINMNKIGIGKECATREPLP